MRLTAVSFRVATDSLGSAVARVALVAAALSLGACDDLQLKLDGVDVFGVDVGTSDTGSADVGGADAGADAEDDAADAVQSDAALTDADAALADAVDPSTLLVPTFNLDGADFLSTPWPSNHRLRPDGSPDLSTFPDATRGLTPTFLKAIHGVVDGYSTMPVVYVHFEGALGSVSLPEPATTVRSGSVVQLLDVSEDGCGERVPVVLSVDLVGDRFRPANTLNVRPVPGFVLEPATPYALVVRRELGLDVGLEVATPPALAAALSGTGDAGLVESVAPLVRCLESDALDVSDVGVATVFTTQNPTRELQLIRDFVVDPERTVAPTVTDLVQRTNFEGDGYQAWTASYETPIFQAGVSPYNSGGGFVFEGDEPVVQRWEQVPMFVVAPLEGGPFPVLVFMPGTGGNLGPTPFSRPALQALEAGFAVATFAPQFHDTRAVNGSDPVLHGFNYLNPVSGRSAFRQQAVDTSYFVRVLREGLKNSALAERLNTERLVYGGHSQGGIVGSFVAGVESEFESYVLNGTGSYMSVTVVQRVDPIDIPSLIEELFNVGRAVDLEHPIIALVQLGTDVVDPHNYAPLWRGGDHNPSGAHVLLLNGFNDTTTFPMSMDAITIAGDADVVAPAGWDVDPYGVWDRDRAGVGPISGNREAVDGSPLTIASFLDPEGTHFTFSRNERARAMSVDFWLGTLEGVPVVE